MKNPSSSEIDLIDVQDRLVRSREALGCLCDLSQDRQLTSALMLIEESLEVAESMLSMFIEKGIEEENSPIEQEAAFD